MEGGTEERGLLSSSRSDLWTEVRMEESCHCEEKEHQTPH